MRRAVDFFARSARNMRAAAVTSASRAGRGPLSAALAPRPAVLPRTLLKPRAPRRERRGMQVSQASGAASGAEEGRAGLEVDQSESAGQRASLLNLPTALTILRVVAVPVLTACWFSAAAWAPAACTAVFLVASVTDFLDGYLARKMNLTSAFGAFLDPVADKLMVTAVLILFATTPVSGGLLAGNEWFYPVSALVIISREIIVSALREWAAASGGEAHKAVAVNNLGKYKTTAQMTALTLMLLERSCPGTTVADIAAAAGAPLLAVAVFLTGWSMAVYMSNAMRYMA
ncbi:unnamed protein product [Pedinophyceae sp. YPF-701]|nr:unnamed protein product [Pedinophyceae sp. YPF-701]